MRSFLQAGILSFFFSATILYGQPVTPVQITKLPAGNYLVLRNSQLSVWKTLTGWQSLAGRPLGQLAIRRADIIQEHGLNIYRYLPDRQVIITYNDHLVELDRISLTQLNISKPLSTFALSRWGDIWYVFDDGSSEIASVRDGAQQHVQRARSTPINQICSFAHEMVLVGDKAMESYDLFGNRLAVIPKPSDAGRFAGLTAEAVIFISPGKNQVVLLSLRPGKVMRYQISDPNITIISDSSRKLPYGWNSNTNNFKPLTLIETTP